MLAISAATSSHEENYVEGYNFFSKCVWTYVYKNLILEGPLNFFISSANLDHFTSNFQYFSSSVKPQIHPLLLLQEQHDLNTLFNLETFMNVYQVEQIDNF